MLQAAAAGRIGIDQQLIRAVLSHGREAVVSEILRFAEEGHSDDVQALEFLLADLIRHYRAAEGLPVLLGYVRRDPAAIPEEIMDALLALGEAAADPLIALYRELEEEEAGDVAFLLAGLGVQKPEIREILLERLEYDAAEGTILLGLYGDPETIPALERIRDEVQSNSAEDRKLRLDLEAAIVSIRQGQPAVAEEPFDILAEYPESSPPDLTAAPLERRLELLDSEREDYRLEAVSALADEEAPAVVDRLLKVAQTDPSFAVRLQAWRALAEREAPDSVRKAAEAVLRAEEQPADARAGALLVLAGEGGERSEAVRTAILRFYEMPQTRGVALEAMRISCDPAFQDYFVRHLDDADAAVRREAILGVGACQLTKLAPRLERYFQDEDCRSEALYAYALAARYETSPGRMPGLLRRIEKLAGGLDAEELQLVKRALDDRLMLHGMKPVYHEPE